MKRNVITIFLLLITAIAQAQEIAVSAGYGTYKMKRLKQVNDDIASDSEDIEVESVDNFPGYYTFGLRFSTPVSESFHLGGAVDLNSTGSRLSYSDYSGQLSVDQKIYGISISALPVLVLSKESKNTFSFDPKIGVTFSQLNIGSTLTIANESETSSVEFHSLNVFAEPGFRYGIWFGGFGVGVRVGYNINVMKGKLFLEEDEEAYLRAGNDDANADWSGLRADISLGLRLSKKR